MTKKDFVKVAEILKRHREGAFVGPYESVVDDKVIAESDWLIAHFGVLFASENRSFNPEKFRKAVIG